MFNIITTFGRWTMLSTKSFIRSTKTVTTLVLKSVFKKYDPWDPGNLKPSVEKQSNGDFDMHMRKALGTKVKVSAKGG